MEIPHVDSLSHKNSKDEEQTALGNIFAMDSEQNNIDYWNRGWLSQKMQREQLQDLHQSNNLLKEVYS